MEQQKNNHKTGFEPESPKKKEDQRPGTADSDVYGDDDFE